MKKTFKLPMVKIRGKPIPPNKVFNDKSKYNRKDQRRVYEISKDSEYLQT